MDKDEETDQQREKNEIVNEVKPSENMNKNPQSFLGVTCM